MFLQKVNMRFDYREAFEASRGTGYEVLLYNCMIGDATLFSRTDLVEAAWRVAQPLLDAWTSTTPYDFPNYPAGSWGPKAAYGSDQRDGRQWVEVINREILEKVPLFQGRRPDLSSEPGHDAETSRLRARRLYHQKRRYGQRNVLHLPRQGGSAGRRAAKCWPPSTTATISAKSVSCCRSRARLPSARPRRAICSCWKSRTSTEFSISIRRSPRPYARRSRTVIHRWRPHRFR